MQSTRKNALGVKWDTQNDTLGFCIKLVNKPLKRSSLLSILSSLYDPLGLGAPFLLNKRQIIQQLCRNRLNLDESINKRSSYEWQKWKNNLSMVEDIEIPHGFERIMNGLHGTKVHLLLHAWVESGSTRSYKYPCCLTEDPWSQSWQSIESTCRWNRGNH